MTPVVIIGAGSYGLVYQAYLKADGHWDVRAFLDVGKRAFLGIGCTVVTKIRSPGEDSMIGAGAVVFKAVLEGITVVGVSARPLPRDAARLPHDAE